MDLLEIAAQNMQTRFVDNPHRGIALGLDGDDNTIQLAWIMGRSDNSKNRVYVVEDNKHILRTEAADPSKVEDPSLIIYKAMKSPKSGLHIVSNGDQTDTIANLMLKYRFASGVMFAQALQTRYCEPDTPIFTPRISGFQRGVDDHNVHLAVLSAEPFKRVEWIEAEDETRGQGITVDSLVDAGYSRKEALGEFRRIVGERCRLDYTQFPTTRTFYERHVNRGFGYCLTTYKPNTSETLESFEGEPFLVPMSGTLREIMQHFWSHLEPEWRVALGGKRDVEDVVYMEEPINRFDRVEAGS